MKGVSIVTATSYDRVCYRTEQRDESITLLNMKNGETGVTFGCTLAGETIQVKLANGELDSWERNVCVESFPEQF
jgi:hypothetical protein